MDTLKAFLMLAVETTREPRVSGWWRWFEDHSGAIDAVLAAITAAYVVLTYRLVRSAKKERDHRLWLARSEQARLVGGFIDRVAKTGGPYGDPIPGIDVLKLTMVNASPLPVRRVVGTVYRAGTDKKFGAFKAVPVLKPDEAEENTALIDLSGESPEAMFNLLLGFDDDAGLTWEKYGSLEYPLRIVTDPPRRHWWTRRRPAGWSSPR